MKTYDLNIFYADLGINDETGENEWETRLTIQPYLYEHDSDGLRKTLVATFYATEAESEVLRKAYPNGEYGDDWFDFLENFVKVAPARLVSLMSTLPAPEDAETIGEPLVIAQAPYVPAYYEPHLMVWDDKPDHIVSVNIARMDIPEVAEMWNALTEDESVLMDSNVFFFVETAQELADLYTKGSGDFHLVKED